MWKRQRYSVLFFSSAFISKACFQESQAQETSGSNGDLLVVEKIKTFKQTGHKRVHETQWTAFTNAEVAGRCHCKASLKYFWKVIVIRGGLEVQCKCHAFFKEKEGSFWGTTRQSALP